MKKLGMILLVAGIIAWLTAAKQVFNPSWAHNQNPNHILVYSYLWGVGFLIATVGMGLWLSANKNTSAQETNSDHNR